MIFLRNNDKDFSLWCNTLVPEAFDKLESFRKGRLDIHELRTQYEDALHVKRQLYAVKAFLDEQHVDFLEQVLLRGKSPERDPISQELYRDVFTVWSAVCFPQGKSGLSTIDPVLLGGELKRLRLERSMSVDRVSQIVHVYSKTLYSYEEGDCFVRIDVLYRLSQIYNTQLQDILDRASVPELLKDSPC